MGALKSWIFKTWLYVSQYIFKMNLKLMTLYFSLFASCVLLLQARYFYQENLRGAPFGYLFQRTREIRTILKGDLRINYDLNKSPGCVIPVLEPFLSEIMALIAKEKLPKISCSPENDWVYVYNGTFRISSTAKEKHGNITCELAPVLRRTDFSIRSGEHIRPMLDGAKLPSDFFRVACVNGELKRYQNIHAGVSYKPHVHKHVRETPLPSGAMGYNVLIFGFDSVSRMKWLRNLKKTREYFLRDLRGIEMKGLNIMGDGTVDALLPLLTGFRESELPEARRGFSGAKPLDDYPFIWKNFSKAGYVTAWAEDMANVGTFQFRLKGFKHQPVDHDKRAYFLSEEHFHSRNRPYCLGSEPRHKLFYDWFRQLFLMYGKDAKKFFFGFHSELSHSQFRTLELLDGDFTQFLKDMKISGVLDNSILILMSDHGPRFALSRQTTQGKLEERLPYLGIVLPPTFYKRYPEAVQNLKDNQNRLITANDLHVTLHDILNYKSLTFQSEHIPKTREDKTPRAMSLFSKIPISRTCENADIQAHWCSCLEWNQVLVKDYKNYFNVVNSVVQKINNLTSEHRSKCAELHVAKIHEILELYPKQEVMKFSKSADKHGRVPDMTDTMTSTFKYIQATIETEPGQGRFMVTGILYINSSVFKISSRDISRTNKYGSQPNCIAKDYPYLRPFCYCL